MKRKEHNQTQQTPNEEIKNDLLPPNEARDRVLKRMKNLLVAGAAVGLSACHSDKEQTVVCDPLPPPLECTADQTPSELLWEHTDFWANWTDIDKDPYLSVTLQQSYYYSTDGDQIAFGAPVVEGASLKNLVSDVENKSKLQFDLFPEPDVEVIYIHISLDCDGFFHEAVLKLDISNPPTEESQNVPITIVESDGGVTGDAGSGK